MIRDPVWAKLDHLLALKYSRHVHCKYRRRFKPHLRRRRNTGKGGHETSVFRIVVSHQRSIDHILTILANTNECSMSHIVFWRGDDTRDRPNHGKRQERGSNPYNQCSGIKERAQLLFENGTRDVTFM